MTEEQNLLRDNVRRILEGGTPGAKESDIDLRLSKTWNDLVGAGILGIGIGEELGGSGGTFGDAATLVFEIGRFASDLPLPETTLLANWLNAESSRRHSGGVETVAIADSRWFYVTRNGGDCALSGVVTNVPWARHASTVIVSYEDDDEHLLLWLEPKDFEIETNENLAGEPRDSIVIRGALIPADRCCRSPVTSQTLLLRGALTRSISMAGSMISILDMTRDYACVREQFGRPLYKFQAIRQLLARLSSEVYAAVVTTRAAVEAIESGDGTFETLVASVRVSQAGVAVPRIAHQIRGAIGVTQEDPLHRFTSRLWSWRSEYGNEVMWSSAITNYVRERGGLNSLWSVLTNTDTLITLESS
jgi:acyl-CoA dehydrogenase